MKETKHAKETLDDVRPEQNSISVIASIYVG